MDFQKSSDNKRITIYDIAKEAGVSASTVSRVLTNNANVRKEKKDKIQNIIDKYDFKPNALAKGLSDTKSKIIGIIAADVRNPYYAEVFVACESAAREAGYTVLLCNSLGMVEQESLHLQMLQQQSVDAIIQLGGRVDDLVSDKDYVGKVARITGTIPVVVTGKLDGASCYRVQIDAKKAMDLLMSHLIGLGHKRIALVGGRKNVTSTYEKYKQYLKVLHDHQIEFQEEFFVEGGYNYQTGYEGMNKLIDRHIKPTAVIAINDFSAAGIVRSITEHGYRIPQDISVVSYDNTYIATLLIPTLTSVDYDYKTFGRKLVQAAINAAEDEEVPIQQLVTPTLVIRESSGPAAD